LGDLRRLLNENSLNVEDRDDDQLFYTQLYLETTTRDQFSIGLDSLSRIFQNLNGMKSHLKVEANEDDGSLLVFNSLYNTHPVVIHGNGPSKINLNAYGNYIAERFNLKKGCSGCEPVICFSLDI
jgi:hypothetical protein